MVRKYLNGVTTPVVRKPAGADAFEPFIDYVTARLTEDPHLWARTLCDELEDLGYRLSYPTLTRQIRARNLRVFRTASMPSTAPTRSSTSRPGLIPNGTGWICRTHPHHGVGVRWRICWSDPWPIQVDGGQCWRR